MMKPYWLDRKFTVEPDVAATSISREYSYIDISGI